MMPLFLLIAFSLFLVLGLFRTHGVAARLSQLSCEDLIARLAPVEMKTISAMAVEYLMPGKSQQWSDRNEIWNRIGRADGLARMRANADVLIALAAHAPGCDLNDGINVAEQMRRDGLALRRAVVSIGLGMTCGYGKDHVSLYLHEAAAAYHLMRQRLLMLYEAGSAPSYASLKAAL